MPRDLDLMNTCASGGYLAVSSTMASKSIEYALRRNNAAKALLTFGGACLLGFFGTTQLLRGLTHCNARKYLAKAREVEVLVAQQV